MIKGESKSDRNKKINEKLGFRKNTWPHQFAKDGKPEQIGEYEFRQPMICVHCNKRFVSGLDPRPMDNCPARSDRREMGRILR